MSQTNSRAVLLHFLCPFLVSRGPAQGESVAKFLILIFIHTSPERCVSVCVFGRHLGGR